MRSSPPEPIEPSERVHEVSAEAADLERLRFEVREPALSFEEWIDAGQPDVHTIGAVARLQAKTGVADD